MCTYTLLCNVVFQIDRKVVSTEIGILLKIRHENVVS